MILEKYLIEGMTCHHCVQAVTVDLGELPLKVRNVDIGSAEVEYDENDLGRQEIIDAIKESGYSVKDVEEL